MQFCIDFLSTIFSGCWSTVPSSAVFVAQIVCSSVFRLKRVTFVTLLMFFFICSKTLLCLLSESSYYFSLHMYYARKFFHSVGSFSFRQKLPTFFSKINNSNRFRNKGSQAVGSGFECLLWRTFLQFIPTFFDTRNQWNTKVFLSKFSALWDQK